MPWFFFELEARCTSATESRPLAVAQELIVCSLEIHLTPNKIVHRQIGRNRLKIANIRVVLQSVLLILLYKKTMHFLYS